LSAYGVLALAVGLRPSSSVVLAVVVAIVATIVITLLLELFVRALS
jgi:hypothetical protein